MFIECVARILQRKNHLPFRIGVRLPAYLRTRYFGIYASFEADYPNYDVLSNLGFLFQTFQTPTGSQFMIFNSIFPKGQMTIYPGQLLAAQQEFSY